MRSSLIPLTKKELEFLANRKSLISFIQRKLCQFRLDSYYQPDDVLNESFLRLKKRQEIEDIPNIDAWFRRTAFYIILEYSRKRQRETLMPNKMYEEIPDLNSNSYAESLEKYEHLREFREAFLQLPTEKQELLSLRFVRGLSWNEIADFYKERGEKASAVALRKRHERAIDALRKQFLAKL